MAYLHTSLVLLCFFCSVWPSDGIIHFTHLGTVCIEDCKLVGLEYRCKSTDKDGNVQSMYCSPEINKDYWGRECGECGKGEEEYYWCRPDAFHWGYCGLVTDNKIYYGSTTGAVCYDNCDQIYHGYYWCNTVNGKWDYCSPNVDVTYKDKPCHSGHFCGSHGNSYSWCWTSGSENDYCGPVEFPDCEYIIN